MNKEHLLPALCNALGVPIHEHHDVVGIDKPAIKAKMRELKKKRDKATESGDYALLKERAPDIHGLNRQIRSHVIRNSRCRTTRRGRPSVRPGPV